jgi:hypothetical protein
MAMPYLNSMTEKYYIVFLGWCLHPNTDIPSCVESINWHDLLLFAQKQTIVGIFWLGILRLGSSPINRPSEEDVMEWMGEYQKILRRNKKADNAVISLAGVLSNSNIGFFVFKGQVVAQYYPVPESRTSGDVDFFVFRNDWKKAIKFLSKQTRITDFHSFRHLDFEMNGIPFEMHYHLALFASKGRQQYWDDLIESYFSEILDYVEIDGTLIPTLPPTVNAIYLFVHLYHHFLKEGVALRQFIDWMMFLEAKHDDIVIHELSTKLERLGLKRAFCSFGTILIDILGMDALCFPLEITQSDKRYEKEILGIVLRYGNFGKYGRLTQKSGIVHSLETGMRTIHHAVKFFWLSPSENIKIVPQMVLHSLIKNSLN